MDIEVKNFADLSDQDLSDWRRVQTFDDHSSSPFYAPDFARAVNNAGKKVHVAIAREDRQTTGFLPFHEGRFGKAIPVGGQISDYQGLIGPLKITSDIGSLLKACGVNAYDFNHLPSNQSAMATGQFAQSPSPYLELKDGFDAYYAERRATKNKVMKNAIRNLRLLARDIGQVRVELDDRSETAWQALVAWKNQSFAHMGVPSMLDVPWARAAFETIRHTHNDHFSGMVSSLYVDDTLAAIHFGMRSNTILHWWFPTYDTAYSKYSPGIVLLLEVAKRIPEIGLTRLDLGRGSQPYKKAFASGATTLLEGSVENPMSLIGSARRCRKGIDRSLSRMPILTKPRQFQRRAFNRLMGTVRL